MKIEICTRALLRNNHTYLLVRHSPEWKWVLPGGHIEKNDITLIDAINREIEEEFWIHWVQWISPIKPQLEDDAIKLLPCPFTSYEVNYIDGKWRNRRKIENIFYWFIKDDIHIIPQIEEIFEYRWIPYSEIIAKDFSTFLSVKDIIQAIHTYAEKI
jgi:8-oxo-dGTP pyrophosphatase MutT (NUDIX family)